MLRIINKAIRRTYIVLNKQDNLLKIRQKIRESFSTINPTLSTEQTEEHFIGFIHTYPAWTTYLKKLIPFSMNHFKSHIAHNPYGHTLAEFFKFKNGELVFDKVMNVGVHGAHTDGVLDRFKFINWIDSHNYYFDNKHEINSEGNHQYGLLNRSFICINLKVNKEEWEKIQEYYNHIKDHSEIHKTKKFNMVMFIIVNKMRYIFPSIYERGNCTYWTTKGFQHIGMLLTDSNFPLVSFYKLMINIMYKKAPYFKDNKDIDFTTVLYKGINHESQPKGSLLYPFFWMRHKYSKIWEVETTADIIVELSNKDQNHAYNDIIMNEVDRPHILDNIEKIVEYLDKVLYGKNN